MIGGEGRTVEIDESQFYKAKYNVGRRLGTGWFFGGIDRDDISKIFIVQVPNRKAETLLPIIAQKILPGTTIVSDSWRAYNNITNIGSDFTHLTVNHRLNFVNPRDPNSHTQNVENLWRWAKRKFRSTTKNRSKRYLRISEFIYRRVNCNNMLSTILQDISSYFQHAVPI